MSLPCRGQVRVKNFTIIKVYFSVIRRLIVTLHSPRGHLSTVLYSREYKIVERRLSLIATGRMNKHGSKRSPSRQADPEGAFRYLPNPNHLILLLNSVDVNIFPPLLFIVEMIFSHKCVTLRVFTSRL